MYINAWHRTEYISDSSKHMNVHLIFLFVSLAGGRDVATFFSCFE